MKKNFCTNHDKMNGALLEIQHLMREMDLLSLRLKESESMKGQFLSNTRNEINNPLSVIFSAAAAQLKTDDLQQMKELAALIYRESHAFSFQMENIVKAAELEAGEDELALSNVDVMSVMKDTIDSFSPLAEDKQIEIVLEHLEPAKEDPAYFCTDEQNLRIVLSNLLHNAIKFSHENGEVLIQVSLSSEMLKVSITDHGTGIPEEDKERIFDRFKQLDSGTSKQYMGHGLGLSIVKALMDQLNGNVSFTNSGGSGSQFCLEIPASKQTDVMLGIGLNGNEVLFDEGETF